MVVKRVKPTIIKIPLESATLEITDQGIKIYDSKKTVLDMDLYLVHAIAPVREDGIRIHYMNELETSRIGCHILEYKLESKYSPIEICRDISKKITAITGTFSNERGWIYLDDDELLYTFDNVQINDNHGILYVTESRIIYETEFEIPIDITFEQVFSIKDHKKDIIRVQCDYSSPTLDSDVPSFDIVLPKDADRDAISLSIKEVFADYNLDASVDFSELVKRYSKLEYDELYTIAESMNNDFYQYLEGNSKIIFGKPTAFYVGLDGKLFLACRLHEWDTDLISDITTEELKQRIIFKRYTDLLDFRDNDKKQYERKIKRIKKDKAATSENLKSDASYLQLKNTLNKINASLDMIRSIPSLDNKVRSDALIYYDKRVVILYKEWCKGVPLRDFTDEHNDEWIVYLLKRLDTDQGHEPIVKSHILHEELIENLAIRGRNRATLAKFTAPDHINSKYVYNNCWYDERRKTWYVEDDNLSEFLQTVASYTPHDSEDMIGRHAWGFKRKNVVMFCGLPSIQAIRGGGPEEIEMGYNRRTGQMRRIVLDNTGYHTLPIIRERDITSEMVTNYGKIIAEYEDIRYTISAAGSSTDMTPRTREIFERLYDLAKIPLNERVRRAVFNIETGLSHSPERPLGSDIIEPASTYPNSMYDERFN